MASFFFVVLMIFAALVVAVISSIKVIIEPNQALVERLGRYCTTLKPGLRFIVPFLDKIVYEKPVMTEQVLDIEPQQAITKDSVSLKIDAVVYWKILDIQKSYYLIDDIKIAIETLIQTTLRSAIGQMDLDKTFASRREINRVLLQELDQVTGAWGVKVTRIEVREIMPAKTVLESMELERAAEIRRRANILEARGKAESMEVLAKALNLKPNSREFLKFLIAQQYVDASSKLGESKNSKVVFMDPKTLSNALDELIGLGGTEHLLDSAPNPDNSSANVVKPPVSPTDESSN